ncbi:MAG: hypothetical protein F6K11_02240 [Leptolyngbya sp. SIO3F4]|nr:hypothetical protein [Leptolyngbya sp. SIO3F4]
MVFPLVILDVWVRSYLFDYVSYTNSRNMDPQIDYFEATDTWSVVALGSSEVKWGIAPAAIETELENQGLKTKGFNLGFDGFNLSYYQAILSGLDLTNRLSDLQVVLIGVNLVESYQTLPDNFEDGFPCDGVLQKAVLKSSFAKDYRLAHLCNPNKWPEPLIRSLEAHSSVLRYRQSLRTLVLNDTSPETLIGVISNGLEQSADGFHPHLSAQENLAEVEKDYKRFLADREIVPEAFEPMAPEIWPQLLEPNGFFDAWANYFVQADILPVFFALPTNPKMIDARQRRSNYQNHSELMQSWAERQDVVFIDLGILDHYDQMVDYSDHRHLSATGGVRFSRELGKALAANPAVKQALTNN